MNTIFVLQPKKMAAIAALVLGVSLPTVAQAIPANQWKLATDTADTASQTFVLLPETSVNVNNGTSARDCIIRFSAHAGANEINDGVGVGFAIGSSTVGKAACSDAGGPPILLVEGDLFSETYTTMHVRNIGTGTKTVKACFRAIDQNFNNTATAFISFRTLTVECRTQ